MEKDSQKTDQDVSSGRSSVFSAKQSMNDVAGVVGCPRCGKDVEFRLRQMSSTIPCTHCKYDSVAIGEKLLDRSLNRQQPVWIDRTAKVLVPRKRRNFFRPLPGLVMFAFIGAVVVASIYLSSLMNRSNLDWLSWQTESVQGGELTLETDLGVSEPIPLPPPEITLEQIESLLSRQDLQEALIQAQVWQQMLQDYGVETSDPRLVRLAEIISSLSEQLRPKPTPPPKFFAEFRELLKTTREAVMREDLPAAATAIDRANKLFETHPKELAPYGRSFLAIKQRYMQLKMLVEGKDLIDQRLREASRYLKNRKPTEAAEAIAEAMFLALRTPMDDEEFNLRDERVKSLQLKLRLARGRRAVEDAKRCHDQQDLTARDQQLQVALDLLPDFPGNQVVKMLTRARELAQEEISGPKETNLGKELAFRAAYEEALLYYGRMGSLTDLADQCVEARRLLSQTPNPSDPAMQKIEDLLMSSLEFEVGYLTSESGHSLEDARGLASARMALGHATPWKETPKWLQIDSALRSHSDQVARLSIRQAIVHAEAEEFALAIRTIEPAIALGKPEAKMQAQKLLDTWRQEIDLREQIAQHDEAWEEMRELYRQQKYLAAWRLMKIFIRRFPDTSHAGEIENIQELLLASASQQLAQLDRELLSNYERRNWTKFYEAFFKLEFGEGLPGYQEMMARYQDLVSGLKVQAHDNYLQAAVLIKRIKGDEQAIVDLLGILPEALLLDPRHEKAREMLETVQEEAQRRAKYYLLQARTASPKSPQFKKKLQRVIDLDPDGDFGAKAKELLASLSEAPADE